MISDYVCGELLGIRDVLINGFGGTGYRNSNGASGGNTFGQRIANGDFNVSQIGSRDLIWMIGSVNDVSVNAAYTDAACQAAVQLAVTGMMAAQPDAIIMVDGPQFVKNFQTGSTRYAACQSAVVAAANGDPQVIYVDTSPTTGEAWQTVTGTTGATVGDGSKDYLGYTDGVLYNNLGNYAYAERWAMTTIKQLTLLAA